MAYLEMAMVFEAPNILRFVKKLFSSRIEVELKFFYIPVGKLIDFVLDG